MSVHYALNLFYHAQKSTPFILCPQRTRRPVLIAFSCTLILLLHCSSGDVEVNPGHVCPQVLSLVDFCNRKSLGFMHVNIRSLHPKFVLLTALATLMSLPCLNPGFGRPPKIQKCPSLTTTFSIKIKLPKGEELQSTAEMACRVLSYFPGPCPNNSSF